MARVLPHIAEGRVGSPDDWRGWRRFWPSVLPTNVTGADIMVDGGLLWGA
jgi:hypothetical protein